MEGNELNITSVETTAESGVEVQEVTDPAVSEQVEQAVTQPEGKTDRDAYYADLRRKQELDEARQANARLQQHPLHQSGL